MLIKYGIIAVISFSIVLGIYELLVRRWNGMRFLFGMKPNKRTQPTGTNRLADQIDLRKR